MLTIIMPVFNEASWLRSAITRLWQTPWACDIQLIVTDDASTDESLNVLKSLQRENYFQIIEHQLNQGKGQSIRSALPFVKGEYIAILDSDLEYDPADLIPMLSKFKEGNYDIIFGNRFEFPTSITSWHRLRNRLISSFSASVSNLPLKDVACCLKIVRSKLLQEISLQAKGFEFDVELAIQAGLHNWRWTEHPVSYHPRTVAQGKKITWWDGIKVIYSGLKLKISSAHLLLFTAILLFAGLLYVSLPLGPDPMIDSGRELYVPQALLKGAKLYRDIEYFNGPLSPYVNMVAMWIMGPTFITYKMINLFVLVLTLITLYTLLRRLLSSTVAAFGTLVFISMFAFQLMPVGRIHLFLTPYSQEITHGLLLGLAFLIALFNRRWWITGVFLALILLTKAEFSLASFGALGFYVLSRFHTQFKRPLTLIIFGILGTLLPVALLLMTYLPLAEVIKSLSGSWYYILTTNVIHNPYYVALLGKDQFLSRIPEIVSAFAFLGGSLAVLLLASRFNRYVLLFCSLIFAGIACANLESLQNMLSLTLGLASLFSLFLAYKRKLSPEIISFGVFATLLNLKLFFNSRMAGFGFVLSAPVFLWCYVMLPQALQNRAYKCWAGIITCAMSLSFLYQSFNNLPYNSVRLIHPTHSFILEEPHQNLNEVLNWIKTHVPADKSYLAFPQGLLLNVLTNHPHPSRYTNFMAAEFDMFGEESILADLKNQNPDYVILVERWNKIWADLNPDFFQGDYAQEVQHWLDKNYQSFQTFTGPQWRYRLHQRKKEN